MLTVYLIKKIRRAIIMISLIISLRPRGLMIKMSNRWLSKNLPRRDWNKLMQSNSNRTPPQ